MGREGLVQRRVEIGRGDRVGGGSRKSLPRPRASADSVLVGPES